MSGKPFPGIVFCFLSFRTTITIITSVAMTMTTTTIITTTTTTTTTTITTVTTMDYLSSSRRSLYRQDPASSGGALQTGHIVEIYGSHSREENRSGVSRRELRVAAKEPRQTTEEKLGRRAWGDRQAGDEAREERQGCGAASLGMGWVVLGWACRRGELRRERKKGLG